MVAGMRRRSAVQYRQENKPRRLKADRDKEKLMNSLGQRIAYYRKKNDLTQEQLAEKCSVTAQAVSKWENDLTAPDITLIPALAEMFGITCDELLGVQRAEVSLVDPELVDINKALFRLRVLCAQGDKVNINLPLGLAEVFLKSGMVKIDGMANDKQQSIDFAQIISLVKMGAKGKLLEVQSANGDVVEGWVE